MNKFYGLCLALFFVSLMVSGIVGQSTTAAATTQAAETTVAATTQAVETTVAATTAPPASTDAPRTTCATIKSSAECSGECRWATLTQQCVDAPCQGFTTGTSCPAARCAWKTLAKTCLPKPCSGYALAMYCTAAPGCWWNASLGGCLSKNCYTVQEPFTCQNLKRCNWNGTMCEEIPCGNYTSQECPTDRCRKTLTACTEQLCDQVNTVLGCYRNLFCNYNWMQRKCLRKTCRQYSGWENGCKLNRCIFDAPSKLCFERPCHHWRMNSSACISAQCGFNKTYGGCFESPCMSYSNAAQCSASRSCQWRSNTTFMNHTCARAPCSSFRMPDLCVRPCSWDNTRRTCKSKPCNEYPAENCPAFGCFVSMGICQQFRCSRLRDNATCAAESDCEWIGLAKVCVDKGMFRAKCEFVRNAMLQKAQMQCNMMRPAGRCMFANISTESGGAVQRCVSRPCQKFPYDMCPERVCMKDDTNKLCVVKSCQVLNETDCGNAPFCKWGNATQACYLRDCFEIPDPYTCGERLGCMWDRMNMQCRLIPCKAFTAQPEAMCPKTRCVSVFSKFSGVTECLRKPCAYFGKQTECPPAYCRWGKGVFSNYEGCQPKQCSFFPSQGECNEANCWWFENKCVHKPCRNYFDSGSCLNHNCMWRNEQCTEYPCALFGTNTKYCVESDYCAWRNATSFANASCSLRNCGDFKVASRCPPPCRWESTSNTGTSSSTSGTCVRATCSSFKTQDRCPEQSYECIWNWGICASVKCSMSKSQAACTAAGSPCQWVQGPNVCVDSNLFQAPCTRVTESQACQMMQPAGRCQLITNADGQSNCTEKFTTTGDTKPCFMYPRWSQCPSYCQQNYGYCMNPVCISIGKNTTCLQQGCRWFKLPNGKEVCFDPRLLLFPCKAFPIQNTERGISLPCPNYRCQLNSDQECRNFTQGPTNDDTSSTTQQISCRDITDDAKCNATFRCWWPESQGHCVGRPCFSYDKLSCPASRCRVAFNRCGAPCGGDTPHLCEKLGVCAASADRCLQCGNTQVQCWNASCVNSFDQCSCPPSAPHRCDNGRCTLNATMCVTPCPADAQMRCWDMTCATNASVCPCPPSRPHRCDDTNRCVGEEEQCEYKCPSWSPLKCWDGRCAANLLSCSCDPQHPFRCPTDMKCYANMSSCACRTSTDVRCSARICVPQGTSCVNAETSCPSATPFRCPDGKCSANKLACICHDWDKAVPSIRIRGGDAQFDTSQWLRLTAAVEYTVCGLDLSQLIPVHWGVHVRDQGTDATMSGVAKLYGLSVAVPPGTLTAGKVYAVTARAKGNSSIVAQASVSITAYAPKPEIRVIGGDRVANSDHLTLGAEIRDKTFRYATDANKFHWTCCQDECLTDCPSSITNALTQNEGKQTFRIPGPIPVGNYSFTVIYKGAESTADISVVGKMVPIVRIVRQVRDVYAGKVMILYAFVNFPNRTNYQWYVNGTMMPGQTNATIRIPVEKLPALRKTRFTIVASFKDLQGRASIYVLPRREVTGSCVVKISATESATTIVPLKTKIQIAANFNTNDTLYYSFGYFDRDQWNSAEFPFRLVSFFQPLPYFEGTMPLLWANKAGAVKYYVVARNADRQRVATAYCYKNIVASTVAAATVLAEKYNEIREARKLNDTATVIRHASTATAALSSVTNAQERRNLTRQVLGELKGTLKGAANVLSSTERGEAMMVLKRILNSDSTGADTKDLVRDNVGEVLAMVKAVLSQRDEESALNTEEDGQTTLDVLGQIPIRKNFTLGRDLSDRVRELGRAVARKSQLGLVKRLKAGNLTIEGLRRNAMDLSNRSVGTEARLRFPLNFTLPNKNDTSVAEISSVAFKEAPVSMNGAPKNQNFSGHVVDFHLQVDGVDEAVTNANPKLELRFPVLNKTSITAKTNFTCMYLKKLSDNSEEWTKEGVTFKEFDWKTYEVVCETTHLSTFGTFQSTEPEQTSGTTAAAGTQGAGTTAAAGTQGAGTTASAGTQAAGTTASAGTQAAGTTASAGTQGPAGTTQASGTQSPGATTAAPGPNNAPVDDTTNSTTGAIIGGTIGAIVLLAVIAGVLIKRSQDSKGTAQRDDAVPLNDMDQSAPLSQMQNELTRSRAPYDAL